MKRYRHPVSQRIAEAVAKVKQYELPLTLDNIRSNLKLSWEDWNPAEAMNEARDRRILQWCRDNGHAIVSTVTRERKEFWGCTPDELEEQVRIKREGSIYDQNRIMADEAVIAFLREKRREFGYDVYPELFAEDIERIYRMNHCAPPARVKAA